jgi:DNA invertase Pin-like site-specific DNA recombinase
MPVAGLSIGYARISTDTQDLTAQREALAVLGVRRTGRTSTTD